jgi:hypothetical protein
VVTAIPVQGRWSYAEGAPGGGAKIADSNAFTFGCCGAAIAKCVEAGYKPWKLKPNGSGTLENHHQACTRLLRADYCGDGTAWTVDGRPINLYDFIGIQSDTETWTWEAVWTVGGAMCLFNERVIDATQPYPPCFSDKTTCDFGYSLADALLLNEYKKAYVVK